jgi:hypothetical protein
VPLCFRTALVKMLYLLFVDAYICTYVHAYISTALIDTRRFHRVQLCSTTYSVPFYQVMYILFYILPNTYLNITQQAAMNKLCYYFTSVVLFSKMLKVFLRLYGTTFYIYFVFQMPYDKMLKFKLTISKCGQHKLSYPN